MELRITHRTEGEPKPANGFIGALGATTPDGSTETTIEAADFDVTEIVGVTYATSEAFVKILNRDFIPAEIVNEEDEAL